MEIKKAIIPVAGLGTRFLPLTKVLCKELLPLVDRPIIEYVAKEANDSQINEVTFVLCDSKKHILDYFKRKPKLEHILKTRKQNDLLEKLEKTETEFKDISFCSVLQQTPRGDGDAILKAKSQVNKEEPFGVLFADDVFSAKIPALLQLKNIFATSQKTVLGLKRLPPEKIPSYGIVQVEKIANRLFKIKDLIEKPLLEKAPSDLAICGRYVLPYDVFGYLENTSLTKKGELILAETLKLMLQDGKIIYGYEIEGEWLECGKIIDWLKSNLILCLQHPEYGPVLKEWMKKQKIL